jgi:uncharacterized protein YdbL (DUF1318 family)
MTALSILRTAALALAAGAVLAAGLPAMAQAGRDPVYAAARAAGQVGEKRDGYLGFVTAPAAPLKAKIEDINIKRKAVYAEKAQAKGSTVEEYAFVSACKLILDTVPGEKYEAPDGTWQTRTAAAPARDSRCP